MAWMPISESNKFFNFICMYIYAYVCVCTCCCLCANFFINFLVFGERSSAGGGEVEAMDRAGLFVGCG